MRPALVVLVVLLPAWLGLVSCATVPPSPVPVERPAPPIPPAQAEVDDLARREQAARLEAAKARAQAQTATTDAARASAQASAVLAEAQGTELARLRAEAQARAQAQQRDLERYEAEAQARAAAEVERHLAASHRAQAVRWLAWAGGASVVVAGLLAWLGMPGLAVAVPVGVVAVGATVLGLLQAGPWMGLVMATVLLGSLALGLVLVARAALAAVRFGDDAVTVDPDNEIAIAALHDRHRTAAGIVRGIIKRLLALARKTPTRKRA